jgi:RNA polymerase sigma factor (sigma-70 family)
MQKDKKSNIPPVESLLSAKEKLQLSHIEDKLTHTWNLPALLLIGVDSRRLMDAFAAFIDSMSPLPIERYDIETPADASPLKNGHHLEPAIFHIFNFFNCRGISWDEVSANLIFYRDYIPQFRLKIVILASHDLLNTIIERAYDFYSISGFTGFFRDFALAIERDIGQPGGIPTLVRQYQEDMQALILYRQQEMVIPEVLVKKIYNTALSAYEISKWDEALHLFQEALEIAVDLKNRDLQASIHNYLGNIFFSRGQTSKASDYFQEALDLAKRVKSTVNETRALTNIGSVYFRRGNLVEALDYQNRAVALSKKIGNTRMEAFAFNHIGSIYLRKGEPSKALDCFQRTISIAEKNHLPGLQAASLSKIGDIYLSRGDTERALAYYKDALSLNKSIANQQGEASNLDNIAHLFSLTGEHSAAFEYYQRALTIARTLGDQQLKAYCLTHMGELYFKIGDLKEASKHHQNALVISKNTENLQLKAVVYGNIGSTNLEEDESLLDGSLMYLEKALELAEKAGDCDEITKQYYNLGYLYQQKDNQTKSREYLDKALALAKKTNNIRLEALSIHNIGQTLAKERQHNKALEYFKKALKIYKRIGDQVGEASELLSIGTIYHGLDNYEETLKHYNRAIELGRETDFKEQLTHLRAEVPFYSHFNTIIHIFESKGNIYPVDINDMFKKFINRIQENDFKLIKEIPANEAIDSYLETLIKYFLVKESYFALLKQNYIDMAVAKGIRIKENIPGENILLDEVVLFCQDELEKNDLQRLKKFRESSSFKTFLFVSILRLIYDYYRKNHKRNEYINKYSQEFASLFKDDVKQIEDVYIKIEGDEIKQKIADRLPGLIKKLSADKQLAIKLRFIKNFNISIIARTMGITRYKAQQLMDNAIKTLSREIQKMLSVHSKSDSAEEETQCLKIQKHEAQGSVQTLGK